MSECPSCADAKPTLRYLEAMMEVDHCLCCGDFITPGGLLGLKLLALLREKLGLPSSCQPVPSPAPANAA
jgi:hypothetical protein